MRLSHGDGGLAPGVEWREVKPFGLERRRGARTARGRTAAAVVLSVLGPSSLLRKGRRTEIWLHDPREQTMNGTRAVGLRPELLDRFSGGFHEGRSIRLLERLGEREIRTSASGCIGGRTLPARTSAVCYGVSPSLAAS